MLISKTRDKAGLTAWQDSNSTLVRRRDAVSIYAVDELPSDSIYAILRETFHR